LFASGAGDGGAPCVDHRWHCSSLPAGRAMLEAIHPAAARANYVSKAINQQIQISNFRAILNFD
jgi:hypothetical protein